MDVTLQPLPQPLCQLPRYAQELIQAHVRRSVLGDRVETEPVVVLAYTTRGPKGAHRDGREEVHAVLFRGDEQTALALARRHIKHLEASGQEVDEVLLVHGENLSGPAIQFRDASPRADLDRVQEEPAKEKAS